MRYFLEDIIHFILAMVMLVVLVLVIVFAFIRVDEFNGAVRRVEASTGCEYVGSPKGTGRVGYFDCNGVIETKRIPK